MSCQKHNVRISNLVERLEDEENYEDSANVPNIDSDYSDVEVEQSEYIQEDGNSEDDLSDNEQVTPLEWMFTSCSTYVGRDGSTVWSAVPTGNYGRVGKNNFPTSEAGPTGEAALPKSELDSFHLFFSTDFINSVVHYTNIKIKEVQGNYTRERDARNTDHHEICAFIGILYMGGVCYSRKHNIMDVWRNDGFGVEIFRLVMGVSRFKFLLRMLRFDDVTDPERKMKKQSDKLYYIRELFEVFVDKCKMNYNHGPSVTVDTMLVNLMGPCSFRVVMPSKPGRSGIKVWACSDSETFYTSNLEIFVKKQPDEMYASNYSPKDVLLRMVSHIEESGRNVTCDKTYTSMPLANALLEKKLTMVGLMRKCHQEVPLYFIRYDTKNLNIPRSLFGFNPTGTLVSYRPDKNKNYILLSTLHNDNKIDEFSGEKRQPEIVSHYSKTVMAVEMSEAMQRQYSVSRIARRWPMAIFFFMLNVGALNSYIIYKSNTQCGIKRKDFIFNLGKSLCVEHCRRRICYTYLSQVIKNRICEVFGFTKVSNNESVLVSDERTRCLFCPRSQIRKTITKCCKCNKKICKEHRTSTCLTCVDSGTSMEVDEDDY